MLIDKLTNELHALPMHMPGHKRNTLLAPYLKRLNADIDITEINGFDDKHNARGVLFDAMRAAADVWHSERAYFLVNGASAGMLAGVHAALARKPGRVLMARNCHISAYNAIELAGCEVTYMLSEYDAHMGAYTSLTPKTVKRALDNAPDAELIILTSPTYEGALSDVKRICEIAHASGVIVLVDEAHGAHLGMGGGFPEGAVRAGADIVVNSLHKTLPSLTQTALLHVNGARVDDADIERALQIFETSSPSYLLMASIDGCVQLMRERGEELLRAWFDALNEFREATAGARALEFMGRATRGAFAFDPSKIVFSAANRGVSGAELMSMLRNDFNIEIEMAAPNYALAMTGLGDTRETLITLSRALMKIDGALPEIAPIAPPPPAKLPARALTACDALSRAARDIAIERAEGEICAEYVWAYPPGIPLIVPGEIMDARTLSLIDQYAARGVEMRKSSTRARRALRVLA